VVEDPGGSESHERGGWAFAYDRGPEGDKFKLDEVMGSEALLLGRTTYEGFAEAWPAREGEFADKFNNMKKYVVSSTIGEPEWNNTEVVGVGDIERLREQDGGDILVNGSVQLVKTLIENGLVDELRLMVFPVVLGAGKRLFGETADSASLELVESTPTGETLILIYRPKSG